MLGNGDVCLSEIQAVSYLTAAGQDVIHTADLSPANLYRLDGLEAGRAGGRRSGSLLGGAMT